MFLWGNLNAKVTQKASFLADVFVSLHKFVQGIYLLMRQFAVFNPSMFTQICYNLSNEYFFFPVMTS